MRVCRAVLGVASFQSACSPVVALQLLGSVVSSRQFHSVRSCASGAWTGAQREQQHHHASVPSSSRSRTLQGLFLGGDNYGGSSDEMKISVAQLMLQMKTQNMLLEDRWQDVEPALKLARKEGPPLNKHVYLTAISALGDAEQFDAVMRVWQHMQWDSIKPHTSLYGNTMWACNRCGRSKEALEFFEQMQAENVAPDPTCLFQAIDAFATLGKADEAFELLEQMTTAGITPDVNAYSAVMNVCGMAGQYERTVAILTQMLSIGLTPTDLAYTSAIDACARCGETALRDLLLEIKTLSARPDAASYSATISAFCKRGNVKLAFELLREMKKAEQVPDAYCYNALIEGSSNVGQHGTAIKLLEEMKAVGLKPDRQMCCMRNCKKVLQHWSVDEQGIPDIQNYGISMALAAIRLVLRDMCSYTDTADSKHYIHNPSTDLVIISGHTGTDGSSTDESNSRDDDSILQPCVIEHCSKLGIVCTVSTTDSSRLIITAAQLQQYVIQQQHALAIIKPVRRYGSNYRLEV
eukprot:14959-Heterococcus_DN1.PRE.3